MFALTGWTLGFCFAVLLAPTMQCPGPKHVPLGVGATRCCCVAELGDWDGWLIQGSRLVPSSNDWYCAAKWHIIGGANLHAARAPRFFALPLAENYQSADACRSFLLFWTTFFWACKRAVPGARAIANFLVHHHSVMVHEEVNSCSRRDSRLSPPLSVWAHHLHVHVLHPLHVGLHLYRNNVVYIISFSCCFFFLGSMLVIQPFK